MAVSYDGLVPGSKCKLLAAELDLCHWISVTGRLSRAHLGDTLRHRAWRAQRHVHQAVYASRQAAGDHRALIAYAQVIGMGVGTRTFAFTRYPTSRAAQALQQRTDSRVSSELME